MPRKVHLDVVDNPRVRRISLTGPVTIGRAKGCKLRIQSRSVSRRHCQIDFDDSEVRVTDLGSSNGTWIDGEQLPANKPAVIAAGSVLEIGIQKFRIAYSETAVDDSTQFDQDMVPGDDVAPVVAEPDLEATQFEQPTVDDAALNETADDDAGFLETISSAEDFEEIVAEPEPVALPEPAESTQTVEKAITDDTESVEATSTEEGIADLADVDWDSDPADDAPTDEPVVQGDLFATLEEQPDEVSDADAADPTDVADEPADVEPAEIEPPAAADADPAEPVADTEILFDDEPAETPDTTNEVAAGLAAAGAAAIAGLAAAEDEKTEIVNDVVAVDDSAEPPSQEFVEETVETEPEDDFAFGIEVSTADVDPTPIATTDDDAATADLVAETVQPSESEVSAQAAAETIEPETQTTETDEATDDDFGDFLETDDIADVSDAHEASVLNDFVDGESVLDESHTDLADDAHYEQSDDVTEVEGSDFVEGDEASALETAAALDTDDEPADFDDDLLAELDEDDVVAELDDENEAVAIEENDSAFGPPSVDATADEETDADQPPAVAEAVDAEPQPALVHDDDDDEFGWFDDDPAEESSEPAAVIDEPDVRDISADVALEDEADVEVDAIEDAPVDESDDEIEVAENEEVVAAEDGFDALNFDDSPAADLGATMVQEAGFFDADEDDTTFAVAPPDQTDVPVADDELVLEDDLDEIEAEIDDEIEVDADADLEMGVDEISDDDEDTDGWPDGEPEPKKKKRGWLAWLGFGRKKKKPSADPESGVDSASPLAAAGIAASAVAVADDEVETASAAVSDSDWMISVDENVDEEELDHLEVVDESQEWSQATVISNPDADAGIELVASETEEPEAVTIDEPEPSAIEEPVDFDADLAEIDHSQFDDRSEAEQTAEATIDEDAAIDFLTDDSEDLAASFLADEPATDDTDFEDFLKDID